MEITCKWALCWLVVALDHHMYQKRFFLHTGADFALMLSWKWWHHPAFCRIKVPKGAAGVILTPEELFGLSLWHHQPCSPCVCGGGQEGHSSLPARPWNRRVMPRYCGGPGLALTPGTRKGDFLPYDPNWSLVVTLILSFNFSREITILSK